MRLADQVAIVTGGGRGIGRAIALALARKGARVAICSRTKANVKRVVSELEGLGAAALGVAADVRDEGDVSGFVGSVVERFGRIDILVNNAGVWLPGDLQDYSLADWDTTMATNLRSVFLCSRAVFEPMTDAGGGKIVNISSVWGKERWFGMASWHAAAYCASKFGVNGLTQALSYEWQPYNIRVNSVCPGPVDTAFVTGAPRARERILPEDVADLVVYLASDAARYITGEAIIVDKWRLEADGS